MDKATKGLMAETARDINEYFKGVKMAEHDPAKFAAAVAVNDKMLYDTVQEINEETKHIPGAKTPTAEQLLEMQNWAFNYKKRNPLAKEWQVLKATAAHFNILIINNEPSPGS